MKKIFRMIIFSGVAVILTALWNKGFIIQFDPTSILKASLAIALVYYLIIPLSKLILLPINVITLGLFSTVFYALIIYFVLTNLHLISINDWIFPGTNFLGITINKFSIPSFYNVFISSLSISTIINLLEAFL